MFSIVAGLDLQPVYRLKILRESIDGRHSRWFNELRAFVSSKKNYSAYRQSLSETLHNDLPCVPHMGVHLRDLLILRENIRLRKKDGVPITSLESFEQTVDLLQMCQRRRYTNDIDLDTASALLACRLHAPAEGELMKRSREIEGKMSPRTLQAIRSSSILSESGF